MPPKRRRAEGDPIDAAADVVPGAASALTAAASVPTPTFQYPNFGSTPAQTSFQFPFGGLLSQAALSAPITLFRPSSSAPEVHVVEDDDNFGGDFQEDFDDDLSSSGKDVGSVPIVPSASSSVATAAVGFHTDSGFDDYFSVTGDPGSTNTEADKVKKANDFLSELPDEDSKSLFKRIQGQWRANTSSDCPTYKLLKFCRFHCGKTGFEVCRHYWCQGHCDNTKVCPTT